MALLPTINELTRDIQGGGQVANVFNTLTNQALNQRKQQLQNQYYGPNIESEMANRNALTEGYNIANKFAPDRLSVANEASRMLNEYNQQMNPLNIQRQQQMNQLNQSLNPYKIEEERIKAANADELAKADIAYKNMGGGRGSVASKDLAAFERQLQLDNPQKPDETPNDYIQRIADMSDAYGQGNTTLPNGDPLPPLSWHAKQLQNSVMNRNIPAAAKNQLIQMDQLVTDMKDFDIDAIAEFTGPQGMARLAKAKGQMVINPDDPSIDPMARRFLSALKISISNMDQMRKAYGASVVPDYVFTTLGSLANPNDSIWNDKTQVKQAWKDIVNQ